MVAQWVVVLGLGLALGLVLGYCSAMPRVWRLEKELAQVPRMARELRLEKSKVEGLRREWEKAKALLSDSELELVKVKQKAHLRESELEMALDLAQSKLMAKD